MYTQLVPFCHPERSRGTASIVNFGGVPRLRSRMTEGGLLAEELARGKDVGTIELFLLADAEVQALRGERLGCRG